MDKMRYAAQAILAIIIGAAWGLHISPTGCTQKQAEDITKLSAAILCAIEHAELDDAQLNKVCDLVGSMQVSVQPHLVAHRKKLIEARVLVVQARCKDGGP